MRDRDVREALRRKVFADHIRDPQTLVVEELGLAYGTARVDIAVVNGRFHGFEIKSDADTLQRLNGQICAYNAIFDQVTIVCGTKHLTDVLECVPEWWGVKCAHVGVRNAIHFSEIRRPKLNLNVIATDLASLLWKSEAVSILSDRGMKGVKSKSRPILSQIMADTVPIVELRNLVRHALKVREGWRSDAQRVPYAD